LHEIGKNYIVVNVMRQETGYFAKRDMTTRLARPTMRQIDTTDSGERQRGRTEHNYTGTYKR